MIKCLIVAIAVAMSVLTIVKHVPRVDEQCACQAMLLIGIIVPASQCVERRFSLM